MKEINLVIWSWKGTSGFVNWVTHYYIFNNDTSINSYDNSDNNISDDNDNNININNSNGNNRSDNKSKNMEIWNISSNDKIKMTTDDDNNSDRENIESYVDNDNEESLNDGGWRQRRCSGLIIITIALMIL